MGCSLIERFSPRTASDNVPPVAAGMRPDLGQRGLWVTNQIQVAMVWLAATRPLIVADACFPDRRETGTDPLATFGSGAAHS